MDTWIQELLINMDVFVDEASKRKILERCGPKCPFSHMPNEKLLELRDALQDEQEFLSRLSDVWHFRREDNQYFVIFDRCYCPLVNGDTANASKSMCYCTLGSIKHKFAISLGRDVEVAMLKTVLNGDDECRFRIDV